MKSCRDCGAPFKRSRADTTVRCPDCRGGGKAKPAAICNCDVTIPRDGRKCVNCRERVK